MELGCEGFVEVLLVYSQLVDGAFCCTAHRELEVLPDVWKRGRDGRVVLGEADAGRATALEFDVCLEDVT